VHPGQGVFPERKAGKSQKGGSTFFNHHILGGAIALKRRKTKRSILMHRCGRVVVEPGSSPTKNGFAEVWSGGREREPTDKTAIAIRILGGGG